LFIPARNVLMLGLLIALTVAVPRRRCVPAWSIASSSVISSQPLQEGIPENLREVKRVRGTLCNNPLSIDVSAINTAADARDIQICLERTNGQWHCGLQTQVKPGARTGFFICDGSGGVRYDSRAVGGFSKLLVTASQQIRLSSEGKEALRNIAQIRGVSRAIQKALIGGPLLALALDRPLEATISMGQTDWSGLASAAKLIPSFERNEVWKIAAGMVTSTSGPERQFWQNFERQLR
jgi:hypothetical protein